MITKYEKSYRYTFFSLNNSDRIITYIMMWHCFSTLSSVIIRQTFGRKTKLYSIDNLVTSTYTYMQRYTRVLHNICFYFTIDLEPLTIECSSDNIMSTWAVIIYSRYLYSNQRRLITRCLQDVFLSSCQLIFIGRYLYWICL